MRCVRHSTPSLEVYSCMYGAVLSVVSAEDILDHCSVLQQFTIALVSAAAALRGGGALLTEPPSKVICISPSTVPLISTCTEVEFIGTSRGTTITKKSSTHQLQFGRTSLSLRRHDISPQRIRLHTRSSVASKGFNLTLAYTAAHHQPFIGDGICSDLRDRICGNFY